MKLTTLKEIVASLENDLAENRSKVEAATEMADITNLKIEQRSLENEIKKYNAEIADYAEANNGKVRSLAMSYDERPDFEVRSKFKTNVQDAIVQMRAGTLENDIKLSIPEVYDEDLILYMKDNCELMNEVTITFETGDVVITRSNSVVTAVWGTPGKENELPEAQNFEVNEKVILSPHTLYAKMSITELASIRSQFTFDTTFIQMLGNALIAEICPAIVSGDGVKMPLGIAVDEAVTTVIEVTEADFSNPDFWIDYEDVIEDRYKVGTKLLMNRSSFSTLKKMKDSTGAYLGEYTLNHDGNKNYLLDKPVLKVDSTVLKSFAAAADGEVFAISGNFKHYRLNDASKHPTVRTYKDNNTLEDVFLAAKYIGGRVTVPYSFILFKKKAS